MPGKSPSPLSAMKSCAAGAALAALSLLAAPAHSAELGEKLKIVGDKMQITLETADGPLTIEREMTGCAKIGGVIQPMVPVEGVTPVGEIEVLDAMTNRDVLLVDMRTVEWYLESTIPTAINVPYIEVADRLGDFGCAEDGDSWRCDDAKTVLAFCNGPACGQSPTAIRAMHREGFPMSKVLYYRGGMQSWDALGLTTVEGDF